MRRRRARQRRERGRPPGRSEGACGRLGGRAGVEIHECTIGVALLLARNNPRVRR